MTAFLLLKSQSEEVKFMTLSELQAQIKELPDGTMLLIELSSSEEISDEEVKRDGTGYSAGKAGEDG